MYNTHTGKARMLFACLVLILYAGAAVAADEAPVLFGGLLDAEKVTQAMDLYQQLRGQNELLPFEAWRLADKAEATEALQAADILLPGAIRHGIPRPEDLPAYKAERLAEAALGEALPYRDEYGVCVSYDASDPDTPLYRVLYLPYNLDDQQLPRQEVILDAVTGALVETAEAPYDPEMLGPMAGVAEYLLYDIACDANAWGPYALWTLAQKAMFDAFMAPYMVASLAFPINGLPATGEITAQEAQAAAEAYLLDVMHFDANTVSHWIVDTTYNIERPQDPVYLLRYYETMGSQTAEDFLCYVLVDVNTAAVLAYGETYHGAVMSMLPH